MNIQTINQLFGVARQLKSIYQTITGLLRYILVISIGRMHLNVSPPDFQQEKKSKYGFYTLRPL